ncbi:unnamed protein product [marine sediment metagenome]|uniref:Uncharacterized protein n=1 Tax=marine sediment metagenome TaxID=412755 RepID=X1KPZ9_9ZZZZ
MDISEHTINALGKIVTGDETIDNLTYDLYNLTQEEIKIVEQGC